LRLLADLAHQVATTAASFAALFEPLEDRGALYPRLRAYVIGFQMPILDRIPDSRIPNSISFAIFLSFPMTIFAISSSKPPRDSCAENKKGRAATRLQERKPGLQLARLCTVYIE
jgi:hypothetical protein